MKVLLAQELFNLSLRSKSSATGMVMVWRVLEFCSVADTARGSTCQALSAEERRWPVEAQCLGSVGPACRKRRGGGARVCVQLCACHGHKLSYNHLHAHEQAACLKHSQKHCAWLIFASHRDVHRCEHPNSHQSLISLSDRHSASKSVAVVANCDMSVLHGPFMQSNNFLPSGSNLARSFAHASRHPRIQ